MRQLRGASLPAYGVAQEGYCIASTLLGFERSPIHDEWREIMSLLRSRPDRVLEALGAGFDNRPIWPRALTQPEAHYQQMGIMFGYVAPVANGDGFVLTELGLRESHSPA
jgi:hypothetical protein